MSRNPVWSLTTRLISSFAVSNRRQSNPPDRGKEQSSPVKPNSLQGKVRRELERVGELCKTFFSLGHCVALHSWYCNRPTSFAVCGLRLLRCYRGVRIGLPSLTHSPLDGFSGLEKNEDDDSIHQFWSFRTVIAPDRWSWSLRDRGFWTHLWQWEDQKFMLAIPLNEEFDRVQVRVAVQLWSGTLQLLCQRSICKP